MQQMELTKEEQQKLRELWRSPKFKKARKAMKFLLQRQSYGAFFCIVLRPFVLMCFCFADSYNS